eukprot:CAMPEP_0178402872 /NCGR_PEP_ID=MMETSP0689_2-20121128/17074_1 /TAXON_ID=160604 /ORGANISM="Amphidinium massartii, Strain CS-259" /LENGTH=160 /DNA_ID=CAMNT_0020023803 /DNA_START=87 /DNA_END=568 /DNA_ORIENTATION=-
MTRKPLLSTASNALSASNGTAVPPPAWLQAVSASLLSLEAVLLPSGECLCGVILKGAHHVSCMAQQSDPKCASYFLHSVQASSMVSSTKPGPAGSSFATEALRVAAPRTEVALLPHSTDATRRRATLRLVCIAGGAGVLPPIGQSEKVRCDNGCPQLKPL